MISQYIYNTKPGLSVRKPRPHKETTHHSWIQKKKKKGILLHFCWRVKVNWRWNHVSRLFCPVFPHHSPKHSNHGNSPEAELFCTWSFLQIFRLNAAIFPPAWCTNDAFSLILLSALSGKISWRIKIEILFRNSLWGCKTQSPRDDSKLQRCSCSCREWSCCTKWKISWKAALRRD